MGRIAGLWVTLFSLWLLLSGHYTALLISLGAVSSALAVYVAVRMGILDEEGFPLQLLVKLLAYIPWLLWEILKSNVQVARIVLSPRLPIKPRVVHFHSSQKTDLGRFIYANSITLTPGTITTGIVGQDFEVHALTAHLVDGGEENLMNRKVSALE